MGLFDSLSQGSISPSVNTSAAGSVAQPDWYNQYMQGIAGKGVTLADAGQSQTIPQQSVAGFTPDQTQAFSNIRANQGAWQPLNAQAQQSENWGVQSAMDANGNAQGAVAGPSQNWTDPGKAASYMSPYTDSVVNEIARLGNQNFNENIMPQVNGSMIGSGQFGSERNASVLGKAARDAQQNITGQQASALESGYSTAGNLFNQDAARTQQQGQLQAQTALAGGQLQAGTSLTAGVNQGNLAGQTSALGMADAQALQASGQQQQQLNQTGLDTDYNNTVANNNWGWSNLNNLNSIVRGVQLPTTQTAINNAPLTRTANASPLAQLGATYAQLGQ